MAYVYSTAQTDTAHGNIDMSINVFRGDCARTQTTATFSFGVRFTPNGQTVSNGGRGTRTSNSIAAWYGGVQRFAQASSGNVTAYKGTYYYAYYTDNTSSGHINVNNTTETTCFTTTVTGLSATTTSVKVTIGVGWNDYAGTKRGELTFTLSIPEYHGSVSNGSIDIKDNGNNTFTITATAGSGINNTTKLTNLRWGYNKDYANTYTNKETYTLSVSGTGNTRTVYAKATTKATHGTSPTATNEKAIRQYFLPYAPTGIKLTYNKSRLTVKENWTFTWTSKTDNNTTSPITGHVIRIYKNGQIIKGLQAVSNSNEITLNKSGTNENLHRLTASTSLIINPENFGFKAGDTIKISLAASTKWGDNKYYYSATTETDTWTIANAGTVRVYVNNSWQEGQVWVKVNNAWQEADVVKVKVPSGWEESE